MREAVHAARHLTPCCTNHFMQQTHRCKTSLQGIWFGFKMTTDTEAKLDGNVFGCFVSVEYILMKNNEILQRVCEPECAEVSVGR